jgi:hypothetical protein
MKHYIVEVDPKFRTEIKKWARKTFGPSNSKYVEKNQRRWFSRDVYLSRKTWDFVTQVHFKNEEDAVWCKLRWS